MATKKEKVKLRRVLIVLILLILIFAVVHLIKNKKDDNVQIVNEKRTEEEVIDLENQRIVAKLKNMEERDRMEYYFGMFLDYIESGEYERAYSLLYPEFKETYFPDIDTFKEYAQKTFSEMSNIEHENIERNGDVYVLWIYITDAINGKPGEKKEMNIVIKENYYNDFVISFSVI